jgi:hypothetical protein
VILRPLKIVVPIFKALKRTYVFPKNMLKSCTSVRLFTITFFEKDPVIRAIIIPITLLEITILWRDMVLNSESHHLIVFTKFADSNYSVILTNFNLDAIVKATLTLSPDKNLCHIIVRVSCKMHTSRELSSTHLELRIKPTNFQPVPVVFVPLLVIDKSEQLITLWHCNFQYPSILINLMAHHLI